MVNQYKRRLVASALMALLMWSSGCADLDRRPSSFEHAINRAVMRESMDHSAESRSRVRAISASGLR